MLLVHLTDLHFGCADIQALRAASKYIDEQRPDAVIVTGDISRNGTANELSAACDWLRSLPAPVILTPGNHDVPYFNVWGRMFFPWTRFRRVTAGLRTDVWATRQWHIVPINTARGVQARLNWAQGAIDEGQIKQACDALARAAPGALRIVITHHPLDWPNDAPIHGATIGGASALSRLIAAGAELFLAGHLHFASSRLIGTQALAITSGTLSLRVRHEPCAFTAIRKPSPDVVEAEVLQVVQGVVQSASVRRFELNAPMRATAAELHATS
ncbi:MAG TPA: metallophosphoesterase [Caulobacterales bacterium]|nr:metallophosphoesterase [Caulobacterales bacterium]